MTVSLQRMNPEKLFAYLDGKLSAAERANIEAQIARDPLLQRELEIAREMRRRSPDSREVLGAIGDLAASEASGRLGRRVATAFAILVMLNVLVGVLFIYGIKKSEKSSDLQAREKAVRQRQQIVDSIQKTAENALPPPTLDVDEIRITAPEPERDTLANNVVMLAGQFGGVATKAPPDTEGITVLAELPASRAHEFKRALAPLTQPDFSSPARRRESLPMSEKVNIYVRITDAPGSTP